MSRGRSERWDAGRLIARRVRVAPAASVLVAVITALALVVAAAAPRLVERLATAELVSQLQAIGPVARSLQGSGNFPEDWASDPPPDRGQLYSGLQDDFDLTRQNLPRPLAGLVGAPSWIVQTTPIQGVPEQGGRPLIGLQLTVDPSSHPRFRIVEGAAPATWAATELQPSERTRLVPVDVAVSTVAARQLHLKVGDLIGTDLTEGVPNRQYRISGLFAPVDAHSDFWKQNPSLLPVTTALAQYGVAYPSVAAFVDPVSVGHLADTFDAARISVTYPVGATGVDGADATLLARQLSAATTAGAAQPNSFSPIPLTTGSQQAVETAVERSSLLLGLLALLAAAPMGLLVAVLGLAVQVVVRARRTELILAAARGGSEWQLRGELAAEGAVLSIPLAVVVTALAVVLIPVRVEPAGFVLPALVALAPPLLFAALASTRDRPGPVASTLAPLRGVGEIAVIVLAALAVFLLARRGLAQATASVGVDPLLSLAPLLLAVSVGILVLRGYPLPMRAARRLAVGGRGLSAFVGAVRATRAPTVGLAGVLALVVGISIAVFSAALLTTVESSVTRAAGETVGADARIDAPSLTAAQVRAVKHVTGVRGVAAIDYLSELDATASPFSSVSVLLAQTGPLSTMRSLPSGLTSLVGGRVPVVVSSDVLASMGTVRDATVQGVRVRVVGSLPAASGLGPSSGWMMVDETFTSAFTDEFVPATLLIRADPAVLPRLLAPLRSAVGIPRGADPFGSTITVSTVPQAVADREGEPVIVGVRVGLVSGALLSTPLCLLALVLATVAAGAARARTAGILRTLGMPRRRLAALIAWELVPVAVVSIVAGTALGCALPFAVTAAVDLRPFTGGLHRTVPVLDGTLLALVVGAFALVVLLAGWVAVLVGDRVNPSATLKMGA